jgi:hypothetical protein
MTSDGSEDPPQRQRRVHGAIDVASPDADARGGGWLAAGSVAAAVAGAAWHGAHGLEPAHGPVGDDRPMLHSRHVGGGVAIWRDGPPQSAAPFVPPPPAPVPLTAAALPAALFATMLVVPIATAPAESPAGGAARVPIIRWLDTSVPAGIAAAASCGHGDSIAPTPVAWLAATPHAAAGATRAPVAWSDSASLAGTVLAVGGATLVLSSWVEPPGAVPA